MTRFKIGRIQEEPLISTAGLLILARIAGAELCILCIEVESTHAFQSECEKENWRIHSGTAWSQL